MFVLLQQQIIILCTSLIIVELFTGVLKASKIDQTTRLSIKHTQVRANHIIRNLTTPRHFSTMLVNCLFV